MSELALTVEHVREAVRAALREELGPRPRPESIAEQVNIEEEIYKACSWGRVMDHPRWLTESVPLVGIDEMLPYVRAQARTFGGRVYFIQCGENGPVKVGYSTDVGQRLEELQVANPVRLRLRAVIPGCRAVERFFHQRFCAHHLRGEWFTPSDDMEIVMRGLARMATYLEQVSRD